MQRFWGLFAALAMLVIALAIAPARAQTVDAAAVLADRVLGDPKAPVTIYDYSSMTCPHCAQFHLTTLPELKTKYVDTGKVKFVFRDFPFDRPALMAAAMARCAPAERYYPLLDILFKQQGQWSRAEDPMKALGQIGKLAGMAQATIDACWADKAVIDGVIKSRMDGEKLFKIDSTPTFVINDGAAKISGAQSVEAFAKIIDPLLK
jgi:protein-disulfide isomerase